MPRGNVAESRACRVVQSRSRSAPLVGQEPALPLLSPGITAQLAVGRDHSMAGDGEAHGIAAVCRADSARVRAELPRHLAVRAGLARRNRAQGGPDATLECGTVRIDRDTIQLTQLAGEAL